MRDCRTPFEQLVCLTNMYRSIARSQYPTIMSVLPSGETRLLSFCRGGDELADALTRVMILARYPTLFSDTMVLYNALESFLEGDSQHLDGYLVHVFQGLCLQFKNV